MAARESRRLKGWARLKGRTAALGTFRPSQVRKLRRPEQVAAICYRLRDGAVEFLLVQTRGGRWTFPKGSAEPGLTNAQTAALEAFEEAGVHGRMEEAHFATYTARKRGKTNSRSLTVHAHLCEVTRLGAPQESDRCPTWCSAENARARLHRDRGPREAQELIKVVDRALARIRVRADEPEGEVMPPGVSGDPLQKVRFEAMEGLSAIHLIQEAWFVRFAQRKGLNSSKTILDPRQPPEAAPVEPASAGEQKLLPGGTAPTTGRQKVIAIDRGRKYSGARRSRSDNKKPR